MTLVVQAPPGYAAERAWVTGVVLGEFLGLPFRLETAEREGVRITLDADPGGRELLMPDVLFATPPERWLTRESLPAVPLGGWDVVADLPEAAASRRPTPVLFGAAPATGPRLLASERGLELRVDVLGTAFFMLSRYEEMITGPRDAHGRFTAAASLAQGEGFLDRPIVNEYVDVLWAVLARLWPRLVRRRWTYRVSLTHDVDHPYMVRGRGLAEVGRAAAGDLVRRRSVPLAVARARAYLQARRGRFDRDPAQTFDFLLDDSERNGLQSAFYFICGRTGGEIDGDYTLEDDGIRALIRRIAGRGHEIGLHPSYGTFRAPDETRREFATLLRAAEREGVSQERWGTRQHYLRWENPVTWQGSDDAGLDYDTTLGFADQPGFRCGVCYPFPAFNLATRRPLRLVERPLQAMDTTLLLYLGLSAEESFRRVVDLAGTTRRHGGEFVLLWHNSSLLTPQERRLYARVTAALAA